MFRTAALEQILHNEIPLSKAMGLRVAEYDGTRLSLAAPLGPNTNRHGTAFAGSLYSLAVLCGWGLLDLKLAETKLHKHIVIQGSSIRYLHPVEQDLHAECRLDHTVFEHFLRTLKKHGRARLTLDVTISESNRPAVEFSGRYVVSG